MGTARADGLNVNPSPLGSNSSAANAATNNATPAAPGMSAPLNSPAWPQQLGQQLILLSQRGGEQRVELRLNPPELGPLTVALKVSDQGTQIQFLSANALVRGAVEQALPQLREALAEQGLSLGETSVGEQRQESEQGFADTDGRRSAAGEDLVSLDERPLTEQPATTEIRLDGRVDLYA
ncbi:flagellar hook-length control protein FliK [Halochromatium salexigens]|uniref:flagellar hook-length control protein FliK n=1 Tax=Halochromatium salexigens TaxID=49447 RepID=UPI001911BF81|nr:flagellar hook-length control protein FliK [Halochromatium salexigens]